MFFSPGLQFPPPRSGSLLRVVVVVVSVWRIVIFLCGCGSQRGRLVPAACNLHADAYLETTHSWAKGPFLGVGTPSRQAYKCSYVHSSSNSPFPPSSYFENGLKDKVRNQQNHP